MSACKIRRCQTEIQNLNPQALLAAFHRHQERILTVVREVKSGKAVSKDYFAFGRKFFSESETVSQPEEFERIREMFNRVGRSQLSAFFDVALYHSDIPEYLKDILRRHRQLLSQA